MKRLVIYHGNCIDGFTAAWALWTRFGDEAEYMPAHYGLEPPDVRGRDVYMVDFSYPREQLLRMYDLADSLLVLDHHKTAQDDLNGLAFAQFDMDRSGAGMAWDWAFPDTRRPWLVNYVEDRDLWRFRLESSKAINAYVSTVPQTFADWDRVARHGAIEAVSRGSSVLAYIDRYVREMSEQANETSWDSHPIPIVNAPYINTSELVGSLAEGKLFAIGWFQRGDGKYQYSLRSRGEFDVSEVAKQHGGGGHKNAAGFVSDERVW